MDVHGDRITTLQWPIGQCGSRMLYMFCGRSAEKEPDLGCMKYVPLKEMQPNTWAQCRLHVTTVSTSHASCQWLQRKRNHCILWWRWIGYWALPVLQCQWHGQAKNQWCNTPEISHWQACIGARIGGVQFVPKLIGMPMPCEVLCLTPHGNTMNPY